MSLILELRIDVEDLEKKLEENELLIKKDGEYFVPFLKLIEFIKADLVKVSILPDGPPDGG